MMAAVRSPHVDGTTELSGDEDEPHQDSGDSDAESDGGSDDGEHGMDGDEEDDDGSGASDMEKAEDEDKGNEEGGKESNPNAGWAEAMAKILQKKTPGSKPTILIKNKQLEKMKEKEKQERLEQREKVDKKREWEMMFRVKPDIAVDRDFERTLQRTATRGVVQLFNAVRKHQSTVDEKVKEVGSSERKKAKLLSSVTKKDFIDVLRGTGGGKAMTKAERNAVDDGEEEKPSWSVLKDDFMMGAAMKDWDKESDDEDSHQQTEEPIDDSDSD